MSDYFKAAMAGLLLPMLFNDEQFIPREMKKFIKDPESKKCKCGKDFIPKRNGHYLCPECFEKEQSAT